MPDLLLDSRQSCREMTRHHATTFYFASHRLPLAKRQDAYAVYAFCRYVDDQIDLAPCPSSRLVALNHLKDLLEAVYKPGVTIPPDDPLRWLPAFQETLLRRQIPRNLFEDLLLGVEMDQGTVRLASWPDLDVYCYRVASVVGLIMTYILTEPKADLLEPAKDLGTAMQLTNILRDIAEDWEKDRIYIPLDELARFGLSPDDIAAKRLNDPFRAMMRFQIGRARQYYEQAEPGIRELPRDGSQLTVRLMSTIYGGILDEIERVDFDVFKGRVRVSTTRKIRLALLTWWK